MASSGKDAKPKLVNVTAAVHCNFYVDQRTVEARVQGSAVVALRRHCRVNASPEGSRA